MAPKRHASTAHGPDSHSAPAEPPGVDGLEPVDESDPLIPGWLHETPDTTSGNFSAAAIRAFVGSVARGTAWSPRGTGVATIVAPIDGSRARRTTGQGSSMRWRYALLPSVFRRTHIG